MEMKDLYNQIIIESSRDPEHRHAVPDATISLEGVNPSCGDDITLQLRVKDNIVQEAGFIGEGCAISQASTSLMIDLIEGKTVEEAKRTAALFLDMIKGNVNDEDELESLGDAVALEGVSHMPSRVKCAVLSWHTLQDALGEENKEKE